MRREGDSFVVPGRIDWALLAGRSGGCWSAPVHLRKPLAWWNCWIPSKMRRSIRLGSPRPSSSRMEATPADLHRGCPLEPTRASTVQPGTHRAAQICCLPRAPLNSARSSDHGAASGPRRRCPLFLSCRASMALRLQETKENTMPGALRKQGRTSAVPSLHQLINRRDCCPSDWPDPSGLNSRPS
jgi:hypothetical protein